ncbi:MAG: OmpA family protein [Polyangiaceae bacterium]|nr:OmpA family protein [Polyangiaceae bacterium]
MTGGAVWPAIKTSIGWDVLTEIVAAGPFVGFVQVIEPDASSLRPEDARIAMFGLHGTLLPATRRPSVVVEQKDVAVAKAAPREPAPAPDRDDDGVISIVDACPNEPETVNGIMDDDGCPDAEDLHVAGRFIVLDERIHFSSGTSDINPKSKPVVASLATFLSQHPEYAVIHIGGHADDRGAEDFNLKLSEARARVVRDLLVREGIEPARLTVDAWGESKPLATGRSERAYAENRRVELEILERSEDAK